MREESKALFDVNDFKWVLFFTFGYFLSEGFVVATLLTILAIIFAKVQ